MDNLRIYFNLFIIITIAILPNCSKSPTKDTTVPEDINIELIDLRLLGKWTDDVYSAGIEFKADSTGVHYLLLPDTSFEPIAAFHWETSNDSTTLTMHGIAVDSIPHTLSETSITYTYTIIGETLSYDGSEYITLKMREQAHFCAVIVETVC